MEVRTEYNGNIRYVILEKINIILGDNCSGKTLLTNFLESGFSADEKYFQVNGVEVSNALFNVIYIDENRDVESEIGLKSKGAFNKKVLKPFICDYDEELNELVSKLKEDVQTLIDEKKLEFNYPISNHNIALNSKKVSKLETILFELVSSAPVTASVKEEFYIYQQLSNITNECHNIVIIDDLDRHLDYTSIEKLIEYLENYDNITMIATTSNKYLLPEMGIFEYIDTDFNEHKLMDQIKREMFEKYLKEENANVTLDNYILQNEEFYSEKDYKSYLINNINRFLFEKVEL